jgi:hypothetical protein
MSGFIMAVLVAIAVQLFQRAENWWPMGRKLFGALLVSCARPGRRNGCLPLGRRKSQSHSLVGLRSTPAMSSLGPR